MTDTPLLRVSQRIAFITFGATSVALAIEIVQGAAVFGRLWVLPLVAILAYAGADFLSGFVHFLADNFGSPDTPVIGKAFVQPFREHHSDPKGILQHSFFVANGNNSFVALPPLLFVLIKVEVDSTVNGYLFGAFCLFLSIAILLTNQFHKWAHMDSPPRAVEWLQSRGIILSKEHHDIHHVSPFDTHYCITVGWWNPILQRLRFFDGIRSLFKH